jgi:antitoxin VapB
MAPTSQLNIRNPEAREFALELSRLRGKSVSAVVTDALRESLEREKRALGREGMTERLLAIGREFSRLPVVDPSDPDEMLYDEDGLPKWSLWTPRR